MEAVVDMILIQEGYRGLLVHSGTPGDHAGRWRPMAGSRVDEGEVPLYMRSASSVGIEGVGVPTPSKERFHYMRSAIKLCSDRGGRHRHPVEGEVPLYEISSQAL